MTETSALLLPDEPVSVRLMNTIWADRRGVHDALVDMHDLHAWLSAIDSATTSLPGGGRLRRTDLAAFRALRDGLRRLAALITEDVRASAATDVAVEQAIATVNDAVTRGSMWPQLSLGRSGLERQSAGTATPAMRALSTIAAEAIELFTSEEQLRLRACYAPRCVLYFVKDHPRREWCSTACGNRARAARHYRRHRKQEPRLNPSPHVLQ
ncbi:CGNR zinc finger domain-containing protein [Kribbella sp. NPDC050124]|uniref:CGNR zinc finger domain-containing protein n=1 Tax=Kribbella sp. NPDC050124 TaxID=3364114 RepID=UPI0037A63452